MSAFGGFPKGTFTFLRGIAKNNNKDWFEKNRDKYDEFYVEAAKEFVVAAGTALSKVAPVSFEPRVNGSLFRINRDVRFSKDKTPYKTNLMLRFWEGADRKTARSGFYLRMDAKRVGVGVGAYGFDKAGLARYRKAVAHPKKGGALVKAAAKMTRAGYELQGSHYKKVPKGFDVDGKAAELILHNGLWLGSDEKLPASIGSKSFVSFCVTRWKKMLPIHRWLTDDM